MPAGTGSRRASRWIRCGGGDGYRQEEVSSKESRRRRGGVRPDEYILAVLSPEERLDAALRVAREAFKGATLTVEEGRGGCAAAFLWYVIPNGEMRSG